MPRDPVGLEPLYLGFDNDAAAPAVHPHVGSADVA